MAKYTLTDLRAMDRDLLPPAIVGPVLGVEPYWLNLAARDAPHLIPVPFFRHGSRGQFVKFPRLALIKFLEGGDANES